MVGVADEHRTQAVEGELVVGLGVANRRHLAGGMQARVVGGLAVDRPRRALQSQLGQQPLFDAGHQSAHRVALLEPLLEVAAGVQLFMQPAFLEGFGVGQQFIVAAPGLDRCGGGLGCEHAGLDGGVAALDARGVQRAGVATHQSTAGKHESRQAQQTPRGDGPRAVADALAAFDVRANGGVRFPALHFFERADPRVLVVEPGDEA